MMLLCRNQNFRMKIEALISFGVIGAKRYLRKVGPIYRRSDTTIFG
jgi:hypothetical protein